jgi:hypothetical protein
MSAIRFSEEIVAGCEPDQIGRTRFTGWRLLHVRRMSQGALGDRNIVSLLCPAVNRRRACYKTRKPATGYMVLDVPPCLMDAEAVNNFSGLFEFQS